MKATTMDRISSTYIRLLTTPGIPRDEDYGAALELMHDGYAVGQYHTTSSGEQYIADHIDVFFAFAPTTKGRLFAEELAQAAKKKTLRARLQRLGLVLASACAGAAATMTTDVARSVLGLCD